MSEEETERAAAGRDRRIAWQTGKEGSRGTARQTGAGEGREAGRGKDADGRGSGRGGTGAGEGSRGVGEGNLGAGEARRNRSRGTASQKTKSRHL